jgi:hypothetical protein
MDIGYKWKQSSILYGPGAAIHICIILEEGKGIDKYVFPDLHKYKKNSSVLLPRFQCTMQNSENSLMFNVLHWSVGVRTFIYIPTYPYKSTYMYTMAVDSRKVYCQ